MSESPKGSRDKSRPSGLLTSGEATRQQRSRGRLKVTQIKSTISEKPNQRETIRTLGLKRMHDVVIRDDTPQNRGYIRIVEHLISVEEIGHDFHSAGRLEFLVSTGSGATTSIDRDHAPDGGDWMTDLQQELVSQADGVRVLQGGEFLEWHKDEAGTSLIWSSDKSLHFVLDVLTKTIGNADKDHRGLVDFADRPGQVTSAEAARATALDDPSRVSFLRLEFGRGIAFVWTPTPGSDELVRQTEYAEASIFFTTETIRVAASTLGRTATKQLVALADTIAESVAA